MHRDVMAGHNMCNAIRGHLMEQQRPKYLQPIDAAGRYPWMQEDTASTSGSSTDPSPSASGPNSGGTSRGGTSSGNQQPRPKKQRRA